MQIPKVVAEIGCNHMGEMRIAREMIETEQRLEHVSRNIRSQ